MDTKPATAMAETTLTRALAAYEKQDFTAAAEAFKNAIDSDPSSVEAHYYLGYALYKLKRFDEARVAFTQAYQLRSDYLPPVAQVKK
jgi:Flp pilus assembly protein TadD